MAETLELMATRLAKWFDADDQDRFPTDVRYWCINEARKEIIRNNDLRWGYHKSTWVLNQGDYQEAFNGGSLGLDNWQKPLYLWWYDAAQRGVTYLKHLSLKDYDANYPDPTDVFFQGQPAAYTTDGDYLWITPASEEITLNIRWYGHPADLEAGGGTNTDNLMVNASSAIFWTSMGYANDWVPGEESRDPIWESKATRFIDELVMQENRNRTVGQAPVKLTPGHRHLE
jgi:hypothetical protein